MKSRTRITWAAAAAALSMLLGASSAARAEDGGALGRTELSIMGGASALNENDTAFPDHFINVPAIVAATYHLSPLLAVEGEFTWIIPVKQDVEVGSSVQQNLKSPDVLAYLANLRASWPGRALTPYVVAGAGAVTFLSNTDADRVPQLDQSETAFAVDLGAGVIYPIAERWGLRADVRELVAFPSSDATGLSQNGDADEIWMERGTLGLVYRF
jgi:opacity protein-like surface antigen